MQKFRRSDSEESSSYSSVEGNAVEPGAANEEDDTSVAWDEPGSASLSPLVMMGEGTPEGWLGGFLLELGLGSATRRGSIVGAERDENLKAALASILNGTEKDEPLRLFEVGSEGHEGDMAKRWRSQETLARYCYSTLALMMLGDRSHVREVGSMYRQEINSRIAKDAHYALCYVLGKSWPAYRVTNGDLERLANQ